MFQGIAKRWEEFLDRKRQELEEEQSWLEKQIELCIKENNFCHEEYQRGKMGSTSYGLFIRGNHEVIARHSAKLKEVKKRLERRRFFSMGGSL